MVVEQVRVELIHNRLAERYLGIGMGPIERPVLEEIERADAEYRSAIRQIVSILPDASYDTALRIARHDSPPGHPMRVIYPNAFYFAIGEAYTAEPVLAHPQPFAPAAIAFVEEARWGPDVMSGAADITLMVRPFAKLRLRAAALLRRILYQPKVRRDADIKVDLCGFFGPMSSRHLPTIGIYEGKPASELPDYPDPQHVSDRIASWILKAD